ncbi:MAG TPA: LysR family transcriptional regulator [Candidatus Acidoferrales bacterium]|nr:LysR family transcriptional regulator [Candidatus Acidoferrales bacterium]
MKLPAHWSHFVPSAQRFQTFTRETIDLIIGVDSTRNHPTRFWAAKYPPMPQHEKAKTNIRPRLRIVAGKNIAFGPGKAELLEALEKTGSITRAADKLGMSYMRAWTLIRTMNRCFCEPLVDAVRGGIRGGGGARLTPTGQQVLELYRQMDAKCLGAVQPQWRKLQRLLI